MDLNTPALLRLPTVLARTGLPKSSLYRLIQKRDFPAPVKLSERCSAWPESEVSDWIERKVAERRNQQDLHLEKVEQGKPRHKTGL